MIDSAVFRCFVAEYDKIIATAQRLIEKKGQLVQWHSVPNPIIADSNEPWIVTEPVPVTHDVYICFVPVRDREMRKFLAYIKGSEVPTGRLAGLMGAVNFEPAIKDEVVRDGALLKLADIDLLSPNGQKVLYTIEFEG